jgi:adenine specific DNA methylase Mod
MDQKDWFNFKTKEESKNEACLVYSRERTKIKKEKLIKKQLFEKQQKKRKRWNNKSLAVVAVAAKSNMFVPIARTITFAVQSALILLRKNMRKCVMMSTVSTPNILLPP